jgi:hypothetical protein
MVALTKTERRICFALELRPRTANELRGVLWPGRQPASRNLLHVHIGNLNKRLAAVDRVVRIDREDGRYRLTDTPRNLPAWKTTDPEAVYVG